MSSHEHPLGISFEFFPPNTDAGRDKLIHVRDELAARNPRFFSVTYGAGGSTQARTREVVRAVGESGINTAPHLSCIGSEKAQLRDLLAQYLHPSRLCMGPRRTRMNLTLIVTAQPQPQPNSTSTQVGVDKVISWTTHPPPTT